MAYSGILFHTLAYSGILWHTLSYSGILWHTLAYSGSPRRWSRPQARSPLPSLSRSPPSRSTLLLPGRQGGHQPQDEHLHLLYCRLARALDELGTSVVDHSGVPEVVGPAWLGCRT